MADHPVLQEMQQMFPSLPADLVKSCVLKYSFDREKCIQHLSYLQITFKTVSGLQTYVQDVNKNNPVRSPTPGTVRRTSYPLYHNGNHEGTRNDPVWSAPVSESPFQFGKQSYVIPTRNIQPHNISPRIPSQTQGVTQVGHNFLQGSYAEVGHHTGPRHPSPIKSPVRSPYRENMVTYNPLQLTLPENDYQFQERLSQQQQEHHVSTLEISPGATPYDSNQFRYYTGPGSSSSSQHAGGSHTTLFNVQVPSTPKPSLTTQIFVQTTLAPSPHHFSPVSSSPRYHEPVLMVPPVTPTADKRKASPHMQVGYHLGHDEQAYSEALLVHQQAGLDLLSKELAQKKNELQRMKLDLLSQEQELYQRRSSSSNPVATVEQSGKLCDEIRKLRVDCQCMSMEVDLLNSNQVPLGVTDENFYRHIFPGQQGQIGPASALVSALTPALVVAAPKQPQPQNQDLLPNGSSESKPSEEVGDWRCSQCTFSNHPYLSVCEICEIPRTPLPPTCGNGPARL